MLGESLLIVNPRRKRGRGGRFIKTGRTRRRHSRRASSSRRRRRNPLGAFMPAVANPRRRRRHTVSRLVRRRRTRNPRFTLAGFTRQLIPAGIGGAGALGLDIVLAALPIPAALKTGPFAILTKLLGAVGLGYVAGMVVGKENGRLVMTGALTVVAYNAIRGFARQVAPQLPGLADYEDYEDYETLGAFIEGRALGYVDPAPVLGDYEPPASRDATVMADWDTAN